MSQKSVTFLTGNKTKWEIASKIFLSKSLNLLQEKFDTPEIQDLSVENVAIFSAQYGCNKLNRPVIKNDVGYYIPSLNNFPGPFTKFANHWFTAEQIIELLKDKQDQDRILIIKDCIAYCEPGKEPISFTYENKCIIANKPEGQGGAFDKIIIREGQEKVQSLYTPDEMLDYWSTHLEHYHQMAEHINKILV